MCRPAGEPEEVGGTDFAGRADFADLSDCVVRPDFADFADVADFADFAGRAETVATVCVPGGDPAGAAELWKPTRSPAEAAAAASATRAMDVRALRRTPLRPSVFRPTSRPGTA